MKKCDNCKYWNARPNDEPCIKCENKSEWIDAIEDKNIINFEEYNSLMLNAMTLQSNDLIDKVIEKIVYILYDNDIKLYNPQETIRQIKTILEREGI